ncbi:glycerophosphodiester phosphodiesterase family protein [soil metagenome]
MSTTTLLRHRIRDSRRVRALAAGAAAVSLVLVIALSPGAPRVEAVGVFGTLHSPGDVSFVAGHRGGKDGAPENTIPAFRRAIAGDLDAIETDLQLTSDGVPVLMHDFMLDRTTTGTGPVWASTWDQVKALDAGSWYGPAFAGTRVPRLQDLLDLVRPTSKRVILELKGSWTDSQLKPVVEQIRSRGLAQRIMIAGFDITSLSAAERVGPEIPRAVIIHDAVGDPAVLAATCGAAAIVTSKEFLLSDPDAVERIHEARLGVMAYTLNSSKAWSEAVALGVDGIITDKPGELDSWLATGAG